MMHRGFGRVAAPLLLVLATACSPATTNAPAASTASGTPASAVAVTAGAQIGTASAAPAGWAPPSKITPVDPLPGMFKSVGDTPAQPDARVRVFFLGMQW